MFGIRPISRAGHVGEFATKAFLALDHIVVLRAGKGQGVV